MNLNLYRYTYYMISMIILTSWYNSKGFSEDLTWKQKFTASNCPRECFSASNFPVDAFIHSIDVHTILATHFLIFPWMLWIEVDIY